MNVEDKPHKCQASDVVIPDALHSALERAIFYTIRSNPPVQAADRNDRATGTKAITCGIKISAAAIMSESDKAILSSVFHSFSSKLCHCRHDTHNEQQR